MPTTLKTPNELGNYRLGDKEKTMNRCFGATGLKSGFQLLPFILGSCKKKVQSTKRNRVLPKKLGFFGLQLLPFILLLVVSSAFAQFAAYEDLVPRYPNQMDGRVNMVKGRFSFSATDLVVPGRGLSLDFTRYYHGTAVSRMYRSYLGQGWSHSYQWELDYERKTNDDDETEHYWHVITSSGAQQTFKESSSSTGGETDGDGAGGRF